MVMQNQFISRWKYPAGPGETLQSAFDIPQGITNIDVSTDLIQRYRNFSLDFLFSGVTSADENLTVRMFRANSIEAFSSSTIQPIDEVSITFDSTVVSDADPLFSRDVKNFDNAFLRVVITAPAGVTANVVLNVAAGGQRT